MMDSKEKYIFWIIDCSGSMYGDRISRTEEIARTVIRSTLEKDESVKHIIIDFSNDAFVNQPICNKELLNRFKFPTVGGLTALDKALVCLYGQISMLRADSEIYIILAMDGGATSPITEEVKCLWNMEVYRDAHKYSIQIGNDVDKEIFDAVLGEQYSVIELKDDDNHFVPTKGLITWINNFEEESDDLSIDYEWVNSTVEAYSGTLPYVFVSYAHADKSDVLPIISHIIHSGYRVWYDDGIDPGTEWDDNIAYHVQDCSFFIAFISKNYIESDNCRDELNYARDQKKERLLVYLEDVELPAGMAMRLNRLQALYWHTYKDKMKFYDKLYGANPFELCRNIVAVDKDYHVDAKTTRRITTADNTNSNEYNRATFAQRNWLKEVSKTAVALGTNADTNKLVSLDLCNTRSIAIYGKKGFGKSNLLSLLLESAIQIPKVRLVLWDNGRNELMQNEVISKAVHSNNGNVWFVHSENEFIEYLYGNGYYPLESRKQEFFIPFDEDDVLPLKEFEEKENPFTIFIIHNRMFYRNDSKTETPLLQKIAPYILDESFGSKLFIFSDVQNILDIDMRREFNNYVEHAFLLDDIYKYVLGKGGNSIFSFLDLKDLKDKYGSESAKLGEGYYYDYESNEVLKMKFFLAKS